MISEKTGTQEHPFTVKAELFDNGCIIEVSMDNKYPFFVLSHKKKFILDINHLKASNNEN
jgi:hypothetical protein